MGEQNWKKQQNDSINKIQPVWIVAVEIQLFIKANLRNNIIITSGEESFLPRATKMTTVPFLNND